MPYSTIFTMTKDYRILGFAEIIQETDDFIRRHFFGFITLGLVAALGRFFQEGGQGEVSTLVYILLEIAVNLSRVLLALFVVGNGSIVKGFERIISVFTLKKADWINLWRTMVDNVLTYRIALIVNFIIWLGVAVIVNIVLHVIFSATPALEWFHSTGILATTASKWPVMLFLKNISIIPFSLIFEILFISWIMGINKTLNQ